MWARNGRWILLEMPDFHLAFKVLLHAVNLRHGTDGFTSPPKEGVLRIFWPEKNPTASAGFWTSCTHYVLISLHIFVFRLSGAYELVTVWHNKQQYLMWCHELSCSTVQPTWTTSSVNPGGSFPEGEAEVFENKMCVLTSCTTVFWNVPHSKIISARYYHKCRFFFTEGVCYCCQILMKLEFSPEIFEKNYSKIKFMDNPSSGSQVVPCGWTDRQTRRS
jgi:hypothetical protein